VGVEGVQPPGGLVDHEARVAVPVAALAVRLAQRLEGAPGAAAVEGAALDEPGRVGHVLAGLAAVEGSEQLVAAEVGEGDDAVARPGALAGAREDRGGADEDGQVRSGGAVVAEADHRERIQSMCTRATMIVSSCPS
jgi:hypothetical protein